MVTNKFGLGRFFSVFVCALALVSRSIGAAEGGSLPVPETVFPQLENILTRALEASPRMISNNLLRLQTFEDARVAALRQYPSARGYSQVTGQRDDEVRPTASGGSTERTVTSEKIYYNADISQPVFHWGALRAGAEIGAIRAEMTRNNMVEAYRLLALQVRRDFLNLVILKQNLDNARFEKELAIKRKALVQTRIDTGELVAGMIEPSETAIAEAELDIDRAAYAFESGLESFRRLCGLDDIEASSIPDAIPPITLPAESVVFPLRHNYVEKGGWQDSIRMRNSLLNVALIEQYRRIDRTNLRPKVDLVAGTSQDERSYTLDVSQKSRIASLFIGVRVSWNIFDSFANRHRLRSRAYELERSRLAADETKEDLIAEVRDSAKEVEFAERALGFSERGYRLAGRAVNALKGGVESGRNAEIDVAGAESRERGSRVAVFRARAAYLNATAKFLSVVDADPVAEAAAERIINQ